MATRLKTVEYWFPMLATIADATNTNATQITIYLPETGTKTFRSCVVDVMVHDANATASSITAPKVLAFRLGAAAYTTVNGAAVTNSGEQYTHSFSGDFTSHFTTNWSGTSMTADCYLNINTGATGSRNASIRVTISYEFDDTSTTHVKTVWIPLDAPTSALPTSKSTVYDTVPALDTYLPEASKVYRQVAFVMQGNTEGASTTDKGCSMQVDTYTAYTSELYESALNSDVWYRHIMDITSEIDTSTTHSFYMWATLADFDHPQAYMVVTYEFDASSTTSIMNSVILPMEIDSPMGGPASTDYQRGERLFWIQEQNISQQRVAIFVHWDKSGAISGLNMRVGTGSFLTYTDVAATVCGGAGCMVRNDSAFTLVRGRNTLQFDIYNTDTTDLGYNVSCWWIINYTSDVPAQGIWAANHTVRYNIKVTGTAAAAAQSLIAATAPNLVATNRFMNSVGTNYIYTTNSTGNASGVHIGVERLSGEGGLIWESVYSDIGGADPEVGIRQCWGTARSVFRRWVAGSVVDADSNRLDLETARRWRIALALGAASHDHLDLYITYHGITYNCNGTITNSSGGSVELQLTRADTHEVVMIDTVTGNSAFNFTWFDDTELMYVQAFESNTSIGRSADALAS